MLNFLRYFRIVASDTLYILAISQLFFPSEIYVLISFILDSQSIILLFFAEQIGHNLALVFICLPH